MKPRYTEWSDFLEDEASSEPECIQCPKCEGHGKRWSVEDRRMVVCSRCDGRGLIRNPDHEY